MFLSQETKQLEKLSSSLQMINRFLRLSAFTEEKIPITSVQWFVLKYLSRNPNQTIGQLAKHLSVRQSTMSQMLDRLEKLDLVVRRPDTRDARVKTVELAPGGIRLINQTEQFWRDLLKEPFEQFNSEEKTVLVGLLDRLAKSLTGLDNSI